MKIHFSAIALGLAFVMTSADAFSTLKTAHRHQSVTMFSTPNENAAAMSLYLAKAHEAKLKAVRDAEEKKATEIEALKKEIKALKGASTSEVVTSTPPAASDEDAAAKLLAYQQFMAKYIVDSHKQKVLAVKSAEEAAEKRFEAKLKQLMLEGGKAAPAPAPLAAAAAPTPEPAATEPPADEPKVESTLYTQRNARVVATAKAGKSRWGDMEVQSVSSKAAPAASKVSISPSGGSRNIGASIVGAPANGASANGVTVPAAVKEADHGLRADGGVGGPSLAERVSMGADLSDESLGSLYEQRNKMVAASAKAGKSRWGDKEVERAQSSASASASTSVSTTASPAPSSSNSLYDKRNNMIVAAAKAGKSRWGSKEIERVQSLGATASAAPVAVPPEVEEADHGLRADGGVGGPSLAERVNLGARLF